MATNQSQPETSNDPNTKIKDVVSTPQMAMADSPLRGKESRMCMATVESGDFAGEDVGWPHQ